MMPAEDHTYANNNTQAQIDMQTSHQEFNAIIWEKKIYEKLKENLRNVIRKQKKCEIKWCEFKDFKNNNEVVDTLRKR